MGLVFEKTLGTILLRHRIIRHPHVIGFVADLLCFFHSGERIKNIQICCRIRRMRKDKSRIRNEKVADSSGYVWAGPLLSPNFEDIVKIPTQART